MTLKFNISQKNKSNATTPIVMDNNNNDDDDDFENGIVNAKEIRIEQRHNRHEANLLEQSGILQPKTNCCHRKLCKPSYIPITIIIVLIVFVISFPLLENVNEKSTNTKGNYFCSDSCNIQLVESIPEGLIYPIQNSTNFLSTFNAWSTLLNLTVQTLDIGSFYWTLRGSDFYNHSSAWQGEQIFKKIMLIGTQQQQPIKIRIAQNQPNENEPNLDTQILLKQKAAQVRSVDFQRLFNSGVLHTKLWIIDKKHFYLGSANMDWRSLTQVKELGVLVTNCSCLAEDVLKIFNVYWFLGRNNSRIPNQWPKEYYTKFNKDSPLTVNFNNIFKMNTYFSNSPPPLTPKGRTNDIEAIINTIMNAEKFVYIAVMDYFPLTIYTPKKLFWPYIDDALRKVAIENKITIKLLISWWNHSSPVEDYFLKSLKSLSNSYDGIDIQVKRFIVPSNDDQAKIPFARVNHNKYMVTDNTAYIGTSNWSGDYFINTAGIGLILEDTSFDQKNTIRKDLVTIFERDWYSPYAIELVNE